MEKKLRVGVLGATGMVGQRFISLLENHPWYEVVTVAASPRSAGRTYEEAVGDRWKMTTPMPESVKKLSVMNVNEVEAVAAGVDFVFSAVDMTKEEIKAIEEAYAKTGTPVVSNNSAHRWTPDVPMKTRGKKGGAFLGAIPLIGSFGIAIGYAIIVGWVLKYLFGSLTGVMMNSDTTEYFSGMNIPTIRRGWEFWPGSMESPFTEQRRPWKRYQSRSIWGNIPGNYFAPSGLTWIFVWGIWK